MRKVLFIISQLYKAGAESSLVNLMHRMDKEQYDIDFIVMNQEPVEGATSLIGAVPAQVHLFNAYEQSAGSGYITVQGMQFSEALVSFVDKKNYDLAVHIGEWWTPEFIVHCVQARRKMAWFHADIDKQATFSPEGFFTHDSAFDGYLFVSEHSMDSACAKFPFIREKAYLLHNSIDQEAIVRLSDAPAPVMRGGEKPLLITVANIRTEKNHLRAIEAMKILHEKGHDFTWWNVGHRSVPWIAAELEEKAARYGFGDDYLLLGPHENPYPLLKQADALASLSDHESWSLVITEARCLGVPIVATKTSGATEQVADGKNGVLTDFTAESIAEGIERLLLDKEFNASCREYLKTVDSIPDPIAELEALFSLPAREPMIHVENLGICFRMDVNKTTNLKEWVIRALQRQNKYNDFWALRNLSFDIMRGDIVGVIGRNGAGKSTLLKAISGIIEPAEGKIERRARVVPMLELGSGFDYELSGSENIFLNGAVLGYKEKFIKEHYQEIVDYSEIGDFIHMPLKVYSSGMLARLAFSIATVVKPDILIVDEILAVGDEKFQEKSYRRMMELMTTGTTVLFVSHNLEQIKKMCNRTLWLSNGQMVDYGNTARVCEAYHRHMQEPQA